MQQAPDARGWAARHDRTVTDEHRHTARLIELGRDREAAELGAATSRDARATAPEGGPMEPLEQLDELGPVLGGVVSTITPEQLDNPTPCANFTVRGVLDHMIGGATVFAGAFRGRDGDATPPDSGDKIADFEVALGDLVAAMHEPGALDRTVHAPFGDVAGSDFARFVVLDGLVHGWDMSQATGQPYDPPEQVVVEAFEFARGALDPLRDGDTFKAAVDVPAGATVLEQLVAYTGRDPGGS
jgi:uncharacterized protein (TIGR03086 family)